MKSKRKTRKKSRGAALIISMVFILIFSALAVALASFSGTNLQIASNQQKLNRCRTGANSGHEIMRYWLGKVHMLGNIVPADRFEELVDYIYDDMSSAGLNVVKTYNESGIPIAASLAGVQLNSLPNQSFSMLLTPVAGNLDVVQLDVTGHTQGFSRIVRVNYIFGTRDHSVFDYGVASRGALQLSGNIELEGYNVSVEADVYIESLNQDDALSIVGNSQIAGDVKIVNSDGYADLQGGQAAIGGETAPEAYDHVEAGVPPTEFPLPLPNYFQQYVESDIDMNSVTHTNVRIPAGSNPVFEAGHAFNGVLFIEAPNIVTFQGHVTITGLVIGNGDLYDNSATNQIIFLGTVDSYPVTALPEESQFEQLRNETGTFLMAPGFKASFGGDFETINGAIAANGIEFFGNAGGTINGSVVNYSDEPMTLSGNSDLIFNRSGITDVPAGFGPEIIMHYLPETYTEVIDI